MELIIVEGPGDPRDVAGWEAAIAKLAEHRDEMDALTYDAQLAALQTGLNGARSGPVHIPAARSLREALKK